METQNSLNNSMMKKSELEAGGLVVLTAKTTLSRSHRKKEW